MFEVSAFTCHNHPTVLAVCAPAPTSKCKAGERFCGVFGAALYCTQYVVSHHLPCTAWTRWRPGALSLKEPANLVLCSRAVLATFSKAGFRLCKRPHDPHAHKHVHLPNAAGPLQNVTRPPVVSCLWPWLHTAGLKHQLTASAADRGLAEGRLNAATVRDLLTWHFCHHLSDRPLPPLAKPPAPDSERTCQD